MRIKRIAAVAAAATLALGMTACGGDDADDAATGETKDFAAGSTMERLNKAQSIKIGTKFDQPLFGLKGLDGDPQGFDVEVGKVIAAELGIPASKIEWVETPSAVREQRIEESAVDLVIATYTINDTRKERIDFAGPYYIAGQTILVRADENEITGPDSFKTTTKKICSVQGSTPAKNIEPYLSNVAEQLVVFDVYTKCLDALKGGQVDAITTDNVILTGYMSQNEGQFKLAGETFTEEPYGIGLKKGDNDFRTFLNDTLEASFTDGRYLEAWKNTAGKVDSTDPKIPTVDRY
ncbi:MULTISPECIES: glutamate ABC transporter substrate-binding protein [unclassified Micromonospora]|uniref:glutamate ABC transporter substrate-binding protein n=1 Tax=unclassified Micromonospora TaxID=2617518 RepID=UPI00103363DC|nr:MULTISPECIES: glutamate ABC transporter substrate-binding protein [unclassified Micromonospora]QKW12856.1 glutamate ABC transporter substrate-binding protein [Verrucosispora sp. NA02020]TBL34448.1 glutamate ABC transporter substrate-binding protein [Verrucosispora sp. SN26_14.1]